VPSDADEFKHEHVEGGDTLPFDEK
jgi:hypothetical protein